MKALRASSIYLVATLTAYAQSSATVGSDTWNNRPPAADDWFSNPNSKLFAGHNGRFSFEDVRTPVSNPTNTSYHFQGGFTWTTHHFLTAETSKTGWWAWNLARSTGRWRLYAKPNAQPSQKVAHLAITDGLTCQLKAWSSVDQAGTVSVSRVHGFLCVKYQVVQRQPTGLHNRGEFNHPMTVDFEGAIKSD